MYTQILSDNHDYMTTCVNYNLTNHNVLSHISKALKMLIKQLHWIPCILLLHACSALSAPTITTAVSQSSTSITLTWTQPESRVVDSYEVSFSYQGSCSGFNHTNTTTVDGTTSQYTLTGLQEFSNYTVTVVAVNTALQAAAVESITLSTTARSVFHHSSLYVGLPSYNALLSLSSQQSTPGSHFTHT